MQGEWRQSSRVLTLVTRLRWNITLHAPTALRQYLLNRGQLRPGVGLDVVTERQSYCIIILSYVCSYFILRCSSYVCVPAIPYPFSGHCFSSCCSVFYSSLFRFCALLTSVAPLVPVIHPSLYSVFLVVSMANDKTSELCSTHIAPPLNTWRQCTIFPLPGVDNTRENPQTNRGRG
jgi:hypothetical protein